MELLNDLLSPEGLLSLLTLSLLEIVLGIDNIIFISIICARIKDPLQQKQTRFLGLLVALITRVILLFGITWIAGLKADLFTLFGMGFSGRDIILFCGGIFLLAKTVSELHVKVSGEEEEFLAEGKPKNGPSRSNIIFQIVLIDIVFSFDSILTAVGIVDNILIMVLAVVASMIVMMIFSGAIAQFIEKNPTLKILALAFLLMIGFLLVLEALEVHVPKPYIYSSMAFAFLVELLNMRARKARIRRRKKAREKAKSQST